MSEVKITYRGWPGHYICADRCDFRLNTLIECEGDAIVISTVGGFRPSENSEWVPIGHNRYFETMVFRADGTKYQDADVTDEISVGSDLDLDWSISHVGDGVEIEANAMHKRIVDFIAEKLANGENL